MKKQVICSVTFIFFIVFNSVVSGGINDRIVAYVDTQAITLSELETKFLETKKVLPEITKEEVLNTMINRVLLLGEAKKIRLEAPTDEEILNEYIDLKIKSLIRVKEEDIHDFYRTNPDKFEGKQIEDVWDEIETYLVERDLNEYLKRHINELKARTCVKIQL
ncbi:MAG: hypothetical protein HXY52_08785 [Nitrospirae bacterium]|nr:hypothetical protein [Nitrospirota bacterium]